MGNDQRGGAGGVVVPLLEARTAPLLVRSLFESEDPGPIVAALAHVPELVAPTLAFIGTVLGPSHLDGRVKEIVVLRVSAVTRCRYCVDAHTIVALDSGLDRKEVQALREDEVGEWRVGHEDLPGDRGTADRRRTGREAALVAWVDAFAGDRGPLPRALTDDLLSWFADYEVVELTMLAATTLLLNRFCTTLELPSSPATLARLRREGFS